MFSPVFIYWPSAPPRGSMDESLSLFFKSSHESSTLSQRRWVLGELKKRQASCKIGVFKANLQGACHDNCCSEVARCQAEEGRASKAVFVLCRGDLSTLGASKQAGERSASAEYESVSLSLLPM